MLFLTDLIYAYFLEINREQGKIFNSYWENKNSTAIVDKNVLENPSLVGTKLGLFCFEYSSKISSNHVSFTLAVGV